MKVVQVFLVLLVWAFLADWTTAGDGKVEMEEDLKNADVNFLDPEATKNWVNKVLAKGHNSRPRKKRFFSQIASMLPKLLGGLTKAGLAPGGAKPAAADEGTAEKEGDEGKILTNAFKGAVGESEEKTLKGAMSMGKLMAKKGFEESRQALKGIMSGKPPWATPVPLRELKMEIRPGQAMINNTDLEFPLFEIDTKMNKGAPVAAPPAIAQSPTAAPQPFLIPMMGLGGAMINGCYMTGYKYGDPCYTGPKPLYRCLDLMDAATYIGVGFDGRGVYGPESRKGQVLQYRCYMKQFYIGMSGKREDVPDMLQIAGIYDTEAHSQSFASKATYRTYLEAQAGLSGSSLLFKGSLETAYGQETMRQTTKYLSLYTINIKRFEVYLAKYESNMLQPNFVREFMDLPSDYYSDGSAIAYQDFIERWGTHYVKSADFGGHFELQQTSEITKSQTKQEFQMKAEAAALGLFGMRGASKNKQGESNTHVTGKMTMKLIVEGGSAEIAQVISDGYSRDFKNDLYDWIVSLDEFPKPYKFRLGILSELFRFTSADLFPSKDKTFGCEANQDRLTYVPETGQHYYMIQTEELDPVTNKTVYKQEKKFCPFSQRKELTDHIRDKRIALELAMTMYFRQGPIAYGNFDMTGKKGCFSGRNYADKTIIPTWSKLIHLPFRLRLMLPSAITNTHGVTLNQFAEYKAHFSKRQSMWYYSDTETDEEIQDLDAHVSETLAKHDVAIAGLYLTFEESTGMLIMTNENYLLSKAKFPSLHSSWKDGRVLAYAELFHDFHSFPCTLTFNNGQRLVFPDRTSSNCLKFMAATAGSIYVVMAGSPEYRASWYTTVINPHGMAIYKGDVMKKTDSSFLTMGLGSSVLYQSYFVCVSRIQLNSEIFIAIEYGKSQNSLTIGDVDVTFIDTENVFVPTYFAFGSGEQHVSVSMAKMLRVQLIDKKCGPRLKMDSQFHFCLDAGCHEQCHPLAGCNHPESGIIQSQDCIRCKNLKDYIKGVQHCVTACRRFAVPTKGVCVLQCPTERVEWDGECLCTLAMQEAPDSCIATCPSGMLPMTTSVPSASQCECEIKKDGNCVSECDSDSVLVPRQMAGFYECKKFYRGRVDINPGKYLRKGSDHTDKTPEACAVRCAQNNNVRGTHCQAFTWYANTKKCVIHLNTDACGSLESNRYATHFKRVNCDYLSSGELDATGRREQGSLTNLIDEGIKNTLYECRNACTGKCIGVNYNVDTGECEQVRSNPANNWCPTVKKITFNHVFLLRSSGLDQCHLVACTNPLMWFPFFLSQSHCLNMRWCIKISHHANWCQMRAGFWWLHDSYSKRFEIWKKDTIDFSYY